MSDLRVLTATRYVQPLREGGSLPAIVDTDSGDLFVAKFRGAGQGVKALIAELIVGLLAREAFPIPELALINIPEAFGRSEPDPEIQDLLRASHGINFGMRYLDGAFNFEKGTAVVCQDCKAHCDGEHCAFEGGRWLRIDTRGRVVGEVQASHRR